MATVLQPESIGQTRTADVPIVVEDVHKYYELGDTRVHALRGVSLEIAGGEFVAVMGASGSGKSTFMNILGCLDSPSSGRYFLEGTDVSTLNKRQLAAIRNQKIGFVFQGFNLLSRTTALENAELPAIYARVSEEERVRRADLLWFVLSWLIRRRPRAEGDAATAAIAADVFKDRHESDMLITIVKDAGRHHKIERWSRVSTR